jgi:hypothetical protein
MAGYLCRDEQNSAGAFAIRVPRWAIGFSFARRYAQARRKVVKTEGNRGSS